MPRPQLGPCARRRAAPFRPALLRLEERTAPSASIVKDIVPGPGNSHPQNLTAVGNELYFDAFATNPATDASEIGVWKTDGTPSGTVLLTQVSIDVGSFNGNETGFFTPFKGRVYFTSNGDLWATDGTPGGTAQLAAFPGSTGLLIDGPVVFDGSLYYGNYTTGILYKTDGTAAGTAELAAFLFGPQRLTDVDLPGEGPALYFAAQAGDSLSLAGLYKTDGTATGTTLVKDTKSDNYIGVMVQAGNTLFFNTFGPPNALWKSDGTEAGTTQIMSLDGRISPELAYHGELYFTADRGNGPALWKSDGTAAGTVVVKDVPAGPAGTKTGAVSGLTAFGDALYFTFSSSGGAQLWRTDGTAAGTVPVSNVPQAGVDAVAAVGTGPSDGALYFVSQKFSTTAGVTRGSGTLYETDGTPGHVTAVRRFASPVTNLTAAGPNVYFTAGDPAHGRELWHVTPTRRRQIIAVGAGTVPEVRVYDATTGTRKFDFLAAPANFTGGIRVAVGDVNGDGVDDVITGAGPGGGPAVRVFDGTDGHPIRSFFAYAPTFRGGVFVASADLDQDGFADVITGAGPGGGSRVEVWSGKTGRLIRGFSAYTPTFTGGVTVAAGDLDGTPDVITGAGPGGTPLVKVFDGLTGALVKQVMAFAPTFTGGVSVAAADTDADGNADIVVGAGRGGKPIVNVYSGFDLSLLKSFVAYDSRFAGGVWVGAADFVGAGNGAIVTAPGPGGGPDVRALGPGVPPPLAKFNAFNPAFLGGVFVG